MSRHICVTDKNGQAIVALLRPVTGLNGLAIETDVVCMDHGANSQPRPDDTLMTKDDVSDLANEYAVDGDSLVCSWCGGELPGASAADIEAWRTSRVDVYPDCGRERSEGHASSCQRVLGEAT